MKKMPKKHLIILQKIKIQNEFLIRISQYTIMNMQNVNMN